MTTPTPQILDPTLCGVCHMSLRDRNGGALKYHVCTSGGRWQKPRPPIKTRKGGRK